MKLKKKHLKWFFYFMYAKSVNEQRKLSSFVAENNKKLKNISSNKPKYKISYKIYKLEFTFLLNCLRFS